MRGNSQKVQDVHGRVRWIVLTLSDLLLAIAATMLMLDSDALWCHVQGNEFGRDYYFQNREASQCSAHGQLLKVHRLLMYVGALKIGCATHHSLPLVRRDDDRADLAAESAIVSGEFDHLLNEFFDYASRLQQTLTGEGRDAL